MNPGPTRTIELTADMTIIAGYEAIYKLTFQSSPVGVQATVNGTPITSGGYVELPEGSQVTVTVPAEVTV